MDVTDPTIIDELAALAHALWCAHMAREGWRYGPAFDHDARTHDALVPFHQLQPHDARSTRAGIMAEEIERQLLELVEYPRGVDREFAANEMRVGLVVEDVHTGAPGSVSSWTVGADGALISIMVQWADGEETEVFPPERTIRRRKA